MSVDGLDQPGPLYLRLREKNGRLCICEFYMDGSRGDVPIDGQDVSSIPLGRIEAEINSYFAEAVKDRLGEPGPDISTLASYFNTGLGSRRPVVRAIASGDWVVSSLAAQRYIPAEQGSQEISAGDQAVTVKRVGHAKPRGDDEPIPLRVDETEREYRLSERPTNGLTDTFLRSVKRAYDAAVARGERPNASIRDQLDGVSLKTVQRWVYTARQRGIMLPAGRPGTEG